MTKSFLRTNLAEDTTSHISPLMNQPVVWNHNEPHQYLLPNISPKPSASPKPLNSSTQPDFFEIKNHNMNTNEYKTGEPECSLSKDEESYRTINNGKTALSNNNVTNTKHFGRKLI